MARWLLLMLLLLVSASIGCGGADSGPVKEEDVYKADPAMIEQKKQESMEKAKQFMKKE